MENLAGDCPMSVRRLENGGRLTAKPSKNEEAAEMYRAGEELFLSSPSEVERRIGKTRVGRRSVNQTELWVERWLGSFTPACSFGLPYLDICFHTPRATDKGPPTLFLPCPRKIKPVPSCQRICIIITIRTEDASISARNSQRCCRDTALSEECTGSPH